MAVPSLLPADQHISHSSWEHLHLVKIRAARNGPGRQGPGFTRQARWLLSFDLTMSVVLCIHLPLPALWQLDLLITTYREKIYKATIKAASTSPPKGRKCQMAGGQHNLHSAIFLTGGLPKGLCQVECTEGMALTQSTDLQDAVILIFSACGSMPPLPDTVQPPPKDGISDFLVGFTLPCLSRASGRFTNSNEFTYTTTSLGGEGRTLCPFHRQTTEAQKFLPGLIIGNG